MKRLICLLLALSGCEAFDGGIIPIEHLGPRPDANGDVSGAPAVAIVSPVADAEVDGDWIVVELALSNFVLDAEHAVLLSWTGGTTPVSVTSGEASLSVPISRVPEGRVTIRATLTVQGAAVTFAEVSVSVSRTTPTLTITAPAPDTVLPQAATTFDVAFAVTDYALVPASQAQSQPREGRIAVRIDEGPEQVFASADATLSTPAAGPHTLKAYLVQGDGKPYGGADTTVTLPFEVSPTTSVAIVSPSAGQNVQGARIMVEIAPVGFVTDGAETPGHGTFAVTLDGVSLATKRTGTMLAINGVGTQAHNLVVELTDASGAPLDPPVSATVAFTSEVLPPEVELVLPASDTVKEGLVSVAILPRHLTFSAVPIPGPLVPGTGGWQLFVDDVLKVDKLTTTQTQVALTPGTHRLKARLVDAGGNPYTPSAEHTKTVEVMPIDTQVMILAPIQAAKVPKTFTVAVAFEDFTLSPDIIAPNDPVVPGVGHFHAFLRKQGTEEFIYQGFYLTEAFQLTADSPGVYELKVALHYQNHTPVIPAVEAVTTIEVDDRPGIRIHTPIDNQVVGLDPFAVSVAVDNFEIIPVGEVSTTKGHYHLFIDGVYQGFYVEPVALIDPLLTTPPLEPGSHRLDAVLHDSNHNPIVGARTDGVDFTYDPRPRVRILSPTPGSVLSTAPFELVVETDNFDIVDKAGEEDVVGEGHIHVFVDDAYVDFYTSPRVPVTITTPGTHTVLVTLNENGHDPVEGAVSASVTINVDAAPRVHVVAPSEGSFTYGGDVHLMLDALNMPADAEVRVLVDGDIAYEGDPMLVDLMPLGEGLHEVSTTPIGPTGEPLAGGKLETVRFEVITTIAPTVTWVTPAPNATVLSGATVTIGVENFALDAGLARKPGVPGDGFWTLTVGERTYGPFAGPSAKLPALPKGPTTLIAELWHRDETRVMPFARASVPVTIGGTSPSLSLVSPSAADPLGETFYGPTVPVVVELEDFVLGPDSGWLRVHVDGEQAALVATTSFVLPVSRPGVHTLEIEVVDAAAHAPLSPPVKVSTTFRLGGTTRPTVTISAPTEGQDITGSDVSISFTLSDLALDVGAGGGLGGRRQPGQGAVLVLVDGHVEAVATSSPVVVHNVHPGPHRIELVGAGLDLVPLAPRISDVVNIDAFRP